MNTYKFVEYLNYKFDIKLASQWDNVGMQTPIYSQCITNIKTCLDVTFEIIDECIEKNINFIISHHPLFLNERHKENLFNSKILSKLKNNCIMVYSAHTNLDSQVHGLNYHLVKKMGWNPIACIDDNLGVICEVEFKSIKEVKKLLDDTFGVETRLFDNCSKEIKRVAFCSGSGGSLYNTCIVKGVDLLITGDLKYHEILESSQLSFNLINIDHSVEKFACEIFENVIKEYIN